MLPLQKNTAQEGNQTKANCLVFRPSLEMHIEEAVHDRGHGVQEGFRGDAQFRIDGEVDHGAEVGNDCPGLSELVINVLNKRR